MLRQFRPAIVLLLLMTILTGLAYPLAVTGIAAVLFPYQAGGSLIQPGETVIGSALIGQNFTDPKYFHGRPSATTDTETSKIATPYNAGNSGGSNAGPTSKALIQRVVGDVAALKQEKQGPIPVDLVTASASGLDPDITPAAAAFQVPRVADARRVPPERVRTLVAQFTEDRVLGILGEPRVNVLQLNRALDALK